jgi:hypothetical protein
MHMGKLGKLSKYPLFIFVLALGISFPFYGFPQTAAEKDKPEEFKLEAAADLFVNSSPRSAWTGFKQRPENQVNSGSHRMLIVGQGLGEGKEPNWRGILILFDLSSIPKTAEILEASLFLFHQSSSDEVVGIYRLNEIWKESEANWLEPCSGCTGWSKGWEDGNYVKVATDSKGVNKPGWIFWDVKKDVQAFLSGTPNHGWLLKSVVSRGNTVASFHSKESSQKNLRPFLKVRFRSARAQLAVRITSPEDGVIVNQDLIPVHGTVSDSSASVQINGIKASVSENTFQAVLPITEGINTLTATATDPSGRMVPDSIRVTMLSKGTITGAITDSLTGLPLPSVNVSVIDPFNVSHPALTDGNGQYYLGQVGGGAFRGTFRKPGYLAYDFSGTMAPGRTIVIHAALTPIQPRIRNISITDITARSAWISWASDQLTEGVLEYGSTPISKTSVTDSALSTYHQIPLSNLTPHTTYYFKVTGRNAHGFSASSEDYSFKTLPGSSSITMDITNPKGGDQLSKSETRIEGTVSHLAGKETQVTVNGFLANTYGNQFIANRIPLAEGPNLITALAKDIDGNSATASVTLNATQAENYIRLTAKGDSGTMPMEAALIVESNLDLRNGSLTYSGPAEVEVVSVSGNEYRVKATVEGFYHFTARGTHARGIAYEDTASILVHRKEKAQPSPQEKQPE